jgi:hypothetical protein
MMEMRQILLSVLLLIGQLPRLSNDLQLRGVVLSVATNLPIPRAHVVFSSASDNNATPIATDTLDDGTFVFPIMAVGNFRLSATRNGYVPVRLAVDLSNGQPATNVRMLMISAGSISGRVVDNHGDPVDHAQVQALKSTYTGGRRVFAAAQIALTNDLGEYRLFGLSPDNYIISATISDLDSVSNVGLSQGANAGNKEYSASGNMALLMGDVSIIPGISPRVTRSIQEDGQSIEEANLPLYYPATRDPRSASPVHLTGGANINGVDLIGARALVHRVSGRVIDESGAGASAKLSLVPQDGLVSEVALTAKSDQTTGSFEIIGGAPGMYFLIADAGAYSARVPVDIATTDIHDLTVTIAKGFTISGHVNMDGSSGTIAEVRLTADPQLPGMPKAVSSAVGSDGTFELDGVPTGDYQLGAIWKPPSTGDSGPPYVKSIRMGSIDVLGGLRIYRQPVVPLEINMGARAGNLNGAVITRNSQPGSIVTVVAVPEAEYRRRIVLFRGVTPDSSGRFSLPNLRPGDYKLFAWENAEPNTWLDPDFLKIYETRGKSIHIAEGSNETATLTAIPIE